MKENKRLYRCEISDDDQERLWESGDMAFDSSALCWMYHLNPDAQGQMANIMKLLKDRIWIPNRVMVEYERHREDVISQPIRQDYSSPSFLKSGYLTELRAYIKRVKDNNYFHPYFESEEIERLEEAEKGATDALNRVRQIIESVIKARKAEIEKTIGKDVIHKSVQEITIGTPMPHDRLMSIVAEGDLRYRCLIPPGYCDATKPSVDRFGDLIIWKELMQHANEAKRDVIFVCSDVKEDWCVSDSETGDIICPREELLNEFHAVTDQHVWFYSLKQFIEQLTKRYAPTNSLFSDLESVVIELDYLMRRQVSNHRSLFHEMTVVCDHCHHHVTYTPDDFSWDWPDSSSEEREMGAEIEFINEGYAECPHCGSEHEFTFHVWEYPEGFYNTHDTDAEGCKIVTAFDLSDDIEFFGNEICQNCGEHVHRLGEHGMCPNCEDMFEAKCNDPD